MTPTAKFIPDHLILASTSPRRRQFLKQLGIPFTVIPPGSAAGSAGIDETPLSNETPAAMVKRLSRLKAEAVLHALPALFPAVDQCARPVVIAADTAVVLNKAIMGKPATPAEAEVMLRQLRHQPHQVFSGLTVALYRPDNAPLPITRLHESWVQMRRYANAEIRAYVASGSPLDKAGAYGIQDDSFAPVAHLNGCFASVMGFPFGELAAGLAQLNLSLPEIEPLCRQLIGQPCCLGKP